MTSVGDSGVHVARVSETDTAIGMGSGDVPVLATPRVIAWLEAASVAALHSLPDGMTSVGIHIAVDHTAPSPVGAAIRSVAAVRGVEGKQIEFDVSAFMGDEMIAAGTHTRVIVDRQRFLARVGPA